MYFNGLGTEVNYEKAFYAYQNAVTIDQVILQGKSTKSSQNHVNALRSLADMYSNGFGVPKSPENAAYFTERANRIENKLK